MIWKVPPVWEGGDVWILGGGSSVPKQFEIPSKVIDDVVEGNSPPSAYSPYMTSIHQEHIIAINVSYLIGDWMDMVFFGDLKFFQAHKTRLVDWPGLKVTCHTYGNNISWVKYVPKDDKKPMGIHPDPHMVCWNYNSGAAAISIAANMGAKRIILLGFDMTYNDTGQRHWHNIYKSEIIEKRTRGKIRFNQLFSFTRHLQGFPQIAKDAKARGIEIINLSPESAIEQFPKMTLKEFLKK